MKTQHPSSSRKIKKHVVNPPVRIATRAGEDGARVHGTINNGSDHSALFTRFQVQISLGEKEKKIVYRVFIIFLDGEHMTCK